jgi:hypothetical protein
VAGEAGAGLVTDAIPVDRFLLYDSRKRDGTTEHAVEAAFPLGGVDRQAGD